MSNFMHIGKGMLKLQRMTKWDVLFETRCIYDNTKHQTLDTIIIMISPWCLDNERIGHDVLITPSPWQWVRSSSAKRKV